MFVGLFFSIKLRKGREIFGTIAEGNEATLDVSQERDEPHCRVTAIVIKEEAKPPSSSRDNDSISESAAAPAVVVQVVVPSGEDALVDEVISNDEDATKNNESVVRDEVAIASDQQIRYMHVSFCSLFIQTSKDHTHTIVFFLTFFYFSSSGFSPVDTGNEKNTEVADLK